MQSQMYAIQVMYHWQLTVLLGVVFAGGILIGWLIFGRLSVEQKAKEEKLRRYQLHVTNYAKWLGGEMPDMREVLMSLYSWVEEKPFESVIHGEGHRAWHIQDLREEMRELRAKQGLK